MDLQNKSVLVVGSGISGIGAAESLWKVGACPVIYDENEKLTKEDIAAKLPEGCVCEIALGTLPEEILTELSLVVVSPGVPVDTPFMEGLKGRGLPIWGEIELAYTLGKGKN